MTIGQIFLAIITSLAVNECCDVSPWAARKLVHWSAHRRYTPPAWAEARAEELAAYIDDRPGKLFKLITALGFAVKAIVTRKAVKAIVTRKSGREDQRLLADLGRAVQQVRAELRTLRGQISPHFLNNTMSTIAAFVSTDPTRARDLLIVFAEFARCSLRSVTETTLGDELENIDRYLTLQRARFGERLRAQQHIAPDVRSVVLPFLALQQLVDNAVHNGIERKELGGTVTVSAGVVDHDCLITVEDDGPGTVDADVQAILRTIDDQLHSRFGDDYGLLTDIVPGTGTKISLRVPMVPGAGRSDQT